MTNKIDRARVHSNTESILIITKARDNHLVLCTRELSLWLMTRPRPGRKRGLIVYVDEQLKTSKRFNVAGMKEEHPHLFEPTSKDTAKNNTNQCLASDEGQLRFWNSDLCTKSPSLFDFVITLGGDGTVLFASWLFQTNVPPVIPFSLGSLGFLTPFKFEDYKTTLSHILDQGTRLNMRMRFRATVYRAIDKIDPAIARRRRKLIESSTEDVVIRNIKNRGWCSIEMESGADANDTQIPVDKETDYFRTRPVESIEFLNDLVVDRGPSPYVTMLEVFADDIHLTTAQADGLCISTPTGSTAYSLSAGGSLVHPNIPAILMTPICAHTLSFRPMLIPDTMEMRIAVPYGSRGNAWASFDGRGRIEIKRGDHVLITASPYPFITVSPEDIKSPWFDSVSRTLNWNQRKHQMSFRPAKGKDKKHQVLSKGGEEHYGTSTKDSDNLQQPTENTEGNAPEEDDDDDTHDEEEEDFDIDDGTPSGAQSRTSLWGGTPAESRKASLSSCDFSSFPTMTPLNSLSHYKGKSSLPSSGLISPDRYGPSGPPPPPAPLSDRHLAAVDFRLQSRLNDEAARSQD